MKLFISLLLLTFVMGLSAQNVYWHNNCEPHEECVSWKKCPQLAYIAKNENLKYRKCGRKSQFCCPKGSDLPKCQPDEKCVRLDKCPQFLDIVESDGNTQAKDEILVNRLCAVDTRYKLLSQRAYTCCPVPGNELPKKTICGQRRPDFRIVRGRQANLNEFPWMAMLLYRKRGSSDPKLDFKCGGSLITNRYVLTAGHCIKRSNPWELKRVRLGEHNQTSNPDCIEFWNEKMCAAPHLEMDIEKTIVHESYYNTTRFEADIALIRLKMPVRYTNEIQPICLLPAHIDLKNENLVVAGWGRTEDGELSEILKQAIIKENTPLCINSKQLDMFDPMTQICAGGQGEKDTCKGDSGGPLMATMTQEYDEFLYVAGITSYGATPCGKIGVYTKTGVYFHWIKKNMEP